MSSDLPGMVLHIGQAKTGTSSIQRYLSTHDEQLRAIGAFYPSAVRQGGAHHKMAAVFMEPDKRPPWLGDLSVDDARKALSDEIAQNEGLCPVLSSETFFTVSPRAADIREALGLENLRIVLILRRQDSWLNSLYLHQLAVLETNLPPDEWFERVLQSPVINYRERVAWWEAAFGKDAIAIGGYSAAEDVGGLVPHFCRLAGLGNLEEAPEAELVNQRLSRDGIEILQLLHFRHGFSRQELMPVRSALYKYSSEVQEPPGWGQAFSTEQRKRLLNLCRGDNEELSAGRLDADMRRELLPDEVVDTNDLYPGLSQKRVNQIADCIDAAGMDKIAEAILNAAMMS